MNHCEPLCLSDKLHNPLSYVSFQYSLYLKTHDAIVIFIEELYVKSDFFISKQYHQAVCHQCQNGSQLLIRLQKLKIEQGFNDKDRKKTKFTFRNARITKRPWA